MTKAKIECVLDFGAEIGEGAIWSDREQLLYWVDISAGLLCCFNPASGENRFWNMGRTVGCIALRKGGGVVVALTDGFFTFDLETNQLSQIADTEAEIRTNRFNDGSVDRSGRLFAGTMPIAGPDRDKGPKGSLYCLDTDHSVTKIMDGFHTINGLAFSPDGKTAYVSDSAYWVQTIWAYDYDVDDCKWTNKRVFFDCAAVLGRPDGGAIDADGCYWMAGVSGWQLLRITPQGKIDMDIKMPIEKPTRIAFGGRDLDTLYVTSIGHNGTTPGSRTEQPLAGGLFAVQGLGVKGHVFPQYDG